MANNNKRKAVRLNDLDQRRCEACTEFAEWRKIIGAAMRAQSLAATNQARLLLGPTNVVRIEPTLVGPPIELDNYRRATDELLPAVSASVAAHRDRIEEMFLQTNAEHFVPVP